MNLNTLRTPKKKRREIHSQSAPKKSCLGLSRTTTYPSSFVPLVHLLEVDGKSCKLNSVGRKVATSTQC